MKKNGENVQMKDNDPKIKNEYLQAGLSILGILLVALVLILGITSGFATEKDEVVELWETTADINYYNGQYPEAIQGYTDLQSEETWPKWTLKIAEIYSAQGEYDKSNSTIREAVILRDRALEENSEEYSQYDEEFVNEVVYLFLANGDNDDAISFGEEYLSINDSKKLMRTMFAVYLLNDLNSKAENIVNEYNVNEESAYDLSLYAEMQMMIGNYEDGLESLKEAWNIDNSEIKILDVLNDISIYKKEDLLKEIKEVNKEDEVYNIFLANIYSTDSENVQKAVDIIDELNVEDSLNITAIKLNAYNTLLDSGNVKKAFKELLNIEEENYGVYYVIALEYFNEGDYTKASKYCKMSIKENEDFSDSYTLLNEINKATEVYDGLESYYRLALMKEPFDYIAMVDLADYYSTSVNEYDTAEKYYKYALSIEEDSSIYFNLAQMEEVNENYDKAVKYYKEAIKLDENSSYYRALAKLYLNMSEYELCVNTLREAYDKDENDVLVLNDIAYYYIVVDENIERGFSNIEAAYDEMPDDIDDENKEIITNNYEKIKKTYERYVEDGTISVPNIKFCN